MAKNTIPAFLLVTLLGCGTTAVTDEPSPEPLQNIQVVNDASCRTDQIAWLSGLREHTLGASVKDLRGSCVHEFRVNKSVAPWVPMLAREQVFCGQIERYSANNSTVGGIFDRDNDINVYVAPAPGPSREMFDVAVSSWGVTADFAEMEVTVPEPLRTGNRYFPQPWTSGRLDHMLAGPHCFYGPWVSDNSHPGGPAHAEIHPIKASWWRDGEDLLMFSMQDESARFDQCISYQEVGNPLCRVADEHRADCSVASGTRLGNWGREWTRGPIELQMQYIVDVSVQDAPRSLYIEALHAREVETARVASPFDGPMHYLTDTAGDTLLIVAENPDHDGLVEVQFDTLSSCWSPDVDSLHAVVNLRWALGEEAKWEYGIERGWNWWAPSPQSGRGYLVFRIADVPPVEPLVAEAVTRGLTPAQIDSLRARLIGMRVRWQEVAGQNMPVADIMISSNLEEEYGTRAIESTITGLRGIDSPDSVPAEPDTAGVLTIRNVPLLFGGRVRLAPSDTTADPSPDPGLSITIPSYRMSAAVLDMEALERKPAASDADAWQTFVEATGAPSDGTVPPPSSFSRVSRWRITVQSRLVPLLEDLDVFVDRWRSHVPSPEEGGDLTIPPEQPFPDLTSEYTWSVAARDHAADSAIAAIEFRESGLVSYRVVDSEPSIGVIELTVSPEAPPLVEMAVEYDAADAFGHRSIGDAVVYSLALVDEDRSRLTREALSAAAGVEGAAEVDWVRAAIEFDDSGAGGLSPRSETLLILASDLADDGIVDLPDFERLRVVVGK